MGDRRRRKVDSDEVLESGHPVSGRIVARDGSGAGSLGDHALGLQRDYGNSAVTTVVQRAPKERPASTNLRDVIKSNKPGKKGPKPKPEPAVEDFRPKGPSNDFPSFWDVPKLRGWIQDSEKTAKAGGNDAKRIAGAWDQIFWLSKDWSLGINIGRAWKFAGDETRYKFWVRLANNRGELKPPE